MSESPADSSLIPFPRSSLTKVQYVCLVERVLLKARCFWLTTGYILILFVGEEGPKSRALERMGHRVNHHSHVLDQSKQETNWLPLEFDVTVRLVSWFWKTLKPGQLYIMFISFYWITVASCDKQWRLKRQNVFSVHTASVSVSFWSGNEQFVLNAILSPVQPLSKHFLRAFI